MGSRLALLVSVILLSAAMSNGIRTSTTIGAAGARPGPAVSTAQPAAVEVTTTTTPPVATAAATTTAAPSEQQPSHMDDPYKDSKRKVPNGPDPIHNRRARWGEAPARRV